MDFLDITINGTDGNGGLRRWESTIPWLYLDSYKVNGVPAPLVTVGIGCAVGPASSRQASDEVLGLPWTIEGVAALPAQIQEQYAALCAAPPGYVAGWYQKYTTMRLSDDAMVALCQSRLAGFVEDLKRIFPAYDGWPETCKAGALDLIYGVGPAGFNAYHLFKAACLQENWAQAALQCASNVNIQAYDARNQARRLLFQQAA